MVKLLKSFIYVFGIWVYICMVKKKNEKWYDVINIVICV